jgi:hypothetical protein
MIAALRRTGRIEDVDAAAVALLRHTARALDEVDPVLWPAQVASLARVHLATLRDLRGTRDDDTSITALLAALSAPVGDPADT